MTKPVLTKKVIVSQDDVFIRGQSFVRVTENSHWEPSNPGGGHWMKSVKHSS